MDRVDLEVTVVSLNDAATAMIKTVVVTAYCTKMMRMNIEIESMIIDSIHTACFTTVDIA